MCKTSKTLFRKRLLFRHPCDFSRRTARHLFLPDTSTATMLLYISFFSGLNWPRGPANPANLFLAELHGCGSIGQCPLGRSAASAACGSEGQAGRPGRRAAASRPTMVAPPRPRSLSPGRGAVVWRTTRGVAMPRDAPRCCAVSLRECKKDSVAATAGYRQRSDPAQARPRSPGARTVKKNKTAVRIAHLRKSNAGLGSKMVPAVCACCK